MVEKQENFQSDEKHIEMWKVKRMIKRLDNVKG